MHEVAAPSPPPSERLASLAALIGTEVGVSDWKLIDQAAIDGFATITGDDGPIHTDPIETAKIAPFGGTIVQGFMMLSHLTGVDCTERPSVVADWLAYLQLAEAA